MHTSVLKLVYISTVNSTCFGQPCGHHQGYKIKTLGTFKIIKLNDKNASYPSQVVGVK
jgi:hypothetical protein